MSEKAIDIMSEKAGVRPTMSTPKLANFSRFIASKELSDLQILVDGETINAHKVVLAANCDTFARMFALLDARVKSISIVETEATHFRAFLRYLYTGEFDPCDATASLLKIACNYQCIDLRNLCERQLCLNISAENAIATLTLATETGCDNLKTVACDYIAQHYEHVKTLPDFKQVLELRDGWKMICEALYRQNQEIVCGLKKVTYMFQFDVSGKCNKPRYSSVFMVGNLKWKVSICRIQNYLSVYLKNPCKNTDTFCKVVCVFRLVSLKKEVKSRERKFKGTLKDQFGWGFPHMIEWMYMEDPKKGFVRNNEINLEVNLDVLESGKRETASSSSSTSISEDSDDSSSSSSSS